MALLPRIITLMFTLILVITPIVIPPPPSPAGEYVGRARGRHQLHASRLAPGLRLGRAALERVLGQRLGERSSPATRVPLQVTELATACTPRICERNSAPSAHIVSSLS